MDNKSQRKRGFTLIETVLTIVVIGLISVAAANILVTGIDIYELIVSRNKAFHNARLAMDRMVSEFMLLGTTDIIAVGGAYISFRDDSGADTSFRKATVMMNGNPVEYVFMGDDLLAEDVALLDFTFMRSNWTETDTPAEVNYIGIDLDIQAQANAGSVHLRTGVFPRGFMYTDFQ